MQRKAAEPEATEKPSKPRPTKPKTSGPRRLTYKEKMELGELPGRIDKLEKQIDEFHQQMADPTFYQQDGEEITQKMEQLKSLETELSEVFERWEALEELAD